MSVVIVVLREVVFLVGFGVSVGWVLVCKVRA